MLQRLVWMVPLVLMPGCVGNPFAEQLEKSFVPSAAAPPTSMAPAVASQASPSVAASFEDSDTRAKPIHFELTDSKPRVSTSLKAERIKLKTTTLPPSDQPQEPYRITIHLSGADPAAPAEIVTRTLREADVSFTVERIERVEP
ncbi:hypothetical protein [Synechococcus sp. M16CYN]|uniref:hypothetical protein n=1 Tax=Synechococcus sp. M16CYN TaxID=3103139 RepID=UPI0033410D21